MKTHLGQRLSKDQWTAIVILIVVFAVYLFPVLYDVLHKPFFNYLPGIDIVSTSLLPVSILQRGDFLLDDYRDFFFTSFVSPGFIFEREGHLISRSPVITAVLATPFYGIPLASGWLAHPTQAWLTFPWSTFFVGKFAAIVMATLSVLVFFFCARELTDLRTSTFVSLAFAFGTSVWSVASQGLWQHTPSVLLQLLGMWFVLRGHRRGAAAVAPGAFFFSMAATARANDLFPAVIFTLYVLVVFRSAIIKWIVWAIPPVLFFLGYNWIYNGSPLVFGYQEGITQYVVLLQPEAALGLLISPSRGLLIYSPFYVFAFVGAWWSRLEQRRLFYATVLVSALLGYLILSMYTGWQAGWGYGTRYMTDLLPYLSILLIPAVKRLSTGWQWVGAGLVIFAAIVHSFGLWDSGGRWHWHWDDWDKFDVWSIPENEPLFYLKQYAAMAAEYAAKYLKWKP